MPDGFDPGRVRATATALARKRAREVARAWPVLAADLGEAFTDRFVAFAASRPPPAAGEARVEALLAAARLSARPVRLAATFAARPPRLVVLARAPGLGERGLSIPLAPDRAH